MAEVPFSRFKLKRSRSVDSIQTGLNNIISRMHFSQLLQEDLNALDDDDNITDDNCKLNSSYKDIKATSTTRRKASIVLKTERNCSLIGDRRRRNERIFNVISQKQESENETPPTEKDLRKKSPRRCSSYYDEYSKRESDRQKAREVAANLIRAHNVKKEFSDGMKSSYSFSPTKKSGKVLNRRNCKSGISPTKSPLPPATTSACHDNLVSKIRLHTTATSFPLLKHGMASSRSSRHQVSPEK